MVYPATEPLTGQGASGWPDIADGHSIGLDRVVDQVVDHAGRVDEHHSPVARSPTAYTN